MAGYFGYKMSNNAIDAYKNGEKPLSKWTKKDILKRINELITEEELVLPIALNKLKKLPLKELKEVVLYNSSWHHTSNHYNRTDFYDIDIVALENLTDGYVETLLNKPKTPEIKEEVWECSFLEWSGTRLHPKATEYKEIGVVKGDWFIRKNGSKKKTTANGFKFIRRIV